MPLTITRPSTPRIASIARENSPFSESPSALKASVACFRTRRAAAKSRAEAACGLTALILAEAMQPLVFVGLVREAAAVREIRAKCVPSARRVQGNYVALQ